MFKSWRWNKIDILVSECWDWCWLFWLWQIVCVFWLILQTFFFFWLLRRVLWEELFFELWLEILVQVRFFLVLCHRLLFIVLVNIEGLWIKPHYSHITLFPSLMTESTASCSTQLSYTESIWDREISWQNERETISFLELRCRVEWHMSVNGGEVNWDGLNDSFES